MSSSLNEQGPIPEFSYSVDYPGKGLNNHNSTQPEIKTSEKEENPETEERVNEKAQGIMGFVGSGLSRLKALTAPYVAPMVEKTQQVYTNVMENRFVQGAKGVIDASIKATTPHLKAIAQKSGEVYIALQQLHRKRQWKQLQAKPQDSNTEDMDVDLSMSTFSLGKPSELDRFTVVAPEKGQFLLTNWLRMYQHLLKQDTQVRELDHNYHSIPIQKSQIKKLREQLEQQEKVESNPDRKEEIRAALESLNQFDQQIDHFVESNPGLTLPKW